MQKRTAQSGFGYLMVFLAILAVAVLAVSGFEIYQHHKSNIKSKAAAATSSTQPTGQPQPSTGTQPATTTNQYPGMTQYTNAQYGISFYYPATWRVEQAYPTSSVDAQNTESILWLADTNVATTATTKNKTVYIEVNSRNLASETAVIDGSINGEGGTSANYKQNITLKGKETVKYTIPQSATVNRVMYFFAVGSKTYSVQTFDEETNLARTPDYMTKFNTLVDSLTLPQ